MQLIRVLGDGKALRRDDANRLWLYDADSNLLGQVEKGSLAAQLLALSPQDFGEVPLPESTTTVSVAGPVDPPRRNQTLVERYKAKLAAWRAKRG